MLFLIIFLIPSHLVHAISLAFQQEGLEVGESFEQEGLEASRPPGAPVCPTDPGANSFLQHQLPNDGRAYGHRHCAPNPEQQIAEWFSTTPPACAPATYADRVESIQGAFPALLEIMKRAKVDPSNWALTNGSLLGQQRCQDVLSWDEDGDISVKESEIPKLQALLDQGKQDGTANVVDKRYLLTQKSTSVDSRGTWIPFVLIDAAPNKGFYIDVFAMKDCEPSGEKGVQSCKETMGYGGRANYLPAKPCDFLGDQGYSCPHDTPGVLSAAYGKNWRTPIRWGGS